MDQDPNNSTRILTLQAQEHKATFLQYKPKVNLERFVDPYDHTNTMENNNCTNHLVNAHDEKIRVEYKE